MIVVSSVINDDFTVSRLNKPFSDKKTIHLPLSQSVSAHLSREYAISEDEVHVPGFAHSYSLLVSCLKVK